MLGSLFVVTDAAIDIANSRQLAADTVLSAIRARELSSTVSGEIII